MRILNCKLQGSTGNVLASLYPVEQYSRPVKPSHFELTSFVLLLDWLSTYMLQLTSIINSELLISSLYDQTRNSARNEFPLRSPLFAHYIQPLTRNYYSPSLARARSVFYRDESLKTNVLFLSPPRRAVHRHIENAAYRTKYKRRQRERVWYCYTHTLLLPCYKTMPHGWMTCWLAGWLTDGAYAWSDEIHSVCAHKVNILYRKVRMQWHRDDV